VVFRPGQFSRQLTLTNPPARKSKYRSIIRRRHEGNGTTFPLGRWVSPGGDTQLETGELQ
jgi:hypothetical protein